MIGVRKRLLALLFPGLLAWAWPLHAGVVWTLQDVVFVDGTTATGTFQYSAATDTMSNWDVVVEAGSFLPAYNYRPFVDGGGFGTNDEPWLPPQYTVLEYVDFVAFPPVPYSGPVYPAVLLTPADGCGRHGQFGFRRSFI